jgi:hypothetical protein
MNYDVTVSTKKFVSSVSAVNLNFPINLGELKDVDSTDKENNYVLIYDASTQKHRYVPASKVLDLADGVDDDSLDYGTY